MEVEIAGQKYTIMRQLSKNRNAWARLRDHTIIISLPSRWHKSERERVAARLTIRAARAIEKGRWKPEKTKKLEFRNGQRIVALGKEYEVSFIPGNRFNGRLDGGRLEIGIVGDHPEAVVKANSAVKKLLIRHSMDEVEKRVKKLNEMHFRSEIKRITLRDTSSRWGSCSQDGSISISLRLLFMPKSILDYVIVHELAHTRYRSHGKRFWTLVEKIVPDHREKRKWLRDNGWKYPSDCGQQPVSGFQPPVTGPETRNTKQETQNPDPCQAPQQTLNEFIIEEPY